MKNKIKAPAELFQKVAELSKASVAQLEKTAEQEQQIKQASRNITKRLVRTGLVDEANYDAMVNDLQEGGVEKLAEVFDSTLDHVGDLISSDMGKSASDSNDAGKSSRRTSEEVWREWFGTPAA